MAFAVPPLPVKTTLNLLAILLFFFVFACLVFFAVKLMDKSISLLEYNRQFEELHPPTPDIVDQVLIDFRLNYMTSSAWLSFQQGQRLAVIVPYRDRHADLEEFLNILPSYLTRHKIDFEIFVIEQQPEYRFNRGMLLNVGFALAVKAYNPTYIALHDVDMLPLVETVDYGFTGSVRSMSSCVQQFGWDLPYHQYLGGVIMVNTKAFLEINGFSNRYWGWGGEDDDLRNRLAQLSVPIYHPSPFCLNQLRNTRAKHSERIPDPNARGKLFASFNKKLIKIDGFSTAKFVLRNETYDQSLRYHHYHVELDVATWVETAHDV